MGRKSLKHLAEPQERHESCTAAVHSTGRKPREMAQDAMMSEDCERRFDATESIEPCPADAAVSEPTEDEIRQRAFEISLTRNGAPGDPMADWLQAEQELRARCSLHLT
ncbi:MAG TPA: DUF2934 domain-containing protein [Phycisphaerae bacterium]|nr:DUF2934 domain-containing protein [Pseudomonadales bacterium]HRX84184.1 DUF2934 domain-containing protein [Phycisphaerae bacterium]